jgi:hypothetical protein
VGLQEQEEFPKENHKLVIFYNLHVFGFIKLSVGLDRHVESVFKEGPSVGNQDDRGVGLKFLLEILVVIVHFLLLDQGCQCFDVLNALIGQLALHHRSLINYDSGVFEKLENSILKFIGVVVLLGRELLFFQELN